ncbi:hypothetical protein MIR68_004348 [Amoeboaphelidium protococcarum]|nr:hypothetical protein MIR68_004348 [Amoeboaphelidium protococcarum]
MRITELKPVVPSQNQQQANLNKSATATSGSTTGTKDDSLPRTSNSLQRSNTSNDSGFKLKPTGLLKQYIDSDIGSSTESLQKLEESLSLSQNRKQSGNINGSQSSGTYVARSLTNQQGASKQSLSKDDSSVRLNAVSTVSPQNEVKSRLAGGASVDKKAQSKQDRPSDANNKQDGSLRGANSGSQSSINSGRQRRNTVDSISEKQNVRSMQQQQQSYQDEQLQKSKVRILGTGLMDHPMFGSQNLSEVTDEYIQKRQSPKASQKDLNQSSSSAESTFQQQQQKSLSASSKQQSSPVDVTELVSKRLQEEEKARQQLSEFNKVRQKILKKSRDKLNAGFDRKSQIYGQANQALLATRTSNGKLNESSSFAPPVSSKLSHSITSLDIKDNKDAKKVTVSSQAEPLSKPMNRKDSPKVGRQASSNNVRMSYEFIAEQEQYQEVKNLLKSQFNIAASSLENLHNRKNYAGRTFIVAAIERQVSRKSQELDFDEGDTMLVTDATHPEWWVALHEVSGRSGLAQASKVKEMESFFAEIVALAEDNVDHFDKHVAESKSSMRNLGDKRKDTEISGIMDSWKSSSVGDGQAAMPENQSWASKAGADLVTKLGKDEVKRQESISEYIETEKKFLEDMQNVLTGYVQPLKDSRVLSSLELQEIFSNLQQIVDIAQVFHRDLTERQKTSGIVIESVGDILLKNLPSLREFAPFCANMSRSIQYILDKKKVSQPFCDKLAECSKNKIFKNMDLNSFLLKPMQRVTKIPLLIKGILKYTKHDSPDFQNLMEAESISQEILLFINNRCGESDERRKLEKIQGKVNFDLTKEISLDFFEPKKRKILYGGPVECNDKKIFAYVFDDVLLFLQYKLVNKVERYTLYRPMMSLWLIDASDSESDVEDTTVSRKTSLSVARNLFKRPSSAKPMKDLSAIFHIHDQLAEVTYEISSHNQRDKEMWLATIEAAQKLLQTYSCFRVDRLRSLPNLPLNSQNIKPKKFMEYVSYVQIKDYVLFSSVEGLYCSRFNSSTSDFYEVQGFQQHVQQLLVIEAANMLILQDGKTGRLEGYQIDNMVLLLDYLHDKDRKGNVPGVKVMKFIESDNCHHFGAGYVDDNLYVIAGTPRFISIYEYIAANRAFKKVRDVLSDDAIDLTSVKEVYGRLMITVKHKFYWIDYKSGIMHELIDSSHDLATGCFMAITCLPINSQQMVLCWSNMGAVVTLKEKNKVKIDKILVWRYNAFDFILQLPYLVVYVQNAIEIWNVENGQLIQLIHAPRCKVVDGTEHQYFTIAESGDSTEILCTLQALSDR